jgi:hypothetical protein
VTCVGTRGFARGGEFIDRHKTCHLRAITRRNSRGNDKFVVKTAILRRPWELALRPTLTGLDVRGNGSGRKFEPRMDANERE